jgi:hypothetical protein
MGIEKRVLATLGDGSGRGFVPSTAQQSSGSRRTVAPGPIVEAWEKVPAAGETAIENTRLAN